MDVFIKQHDTRAKFTDILAVDGLPANLTNATVQFVMRAVGSVGIQQTAVISHLPGTDGAVEYTPVASDVAIAGEFEQQWRVNFADGTKVTFPNNGYNTVTILPDLV